MLKNIELGHFECQHCARELAAGKKAKKKKCVEIQGYGISAQPTIVIENAVTGDRETMSEGYHKVWREQLILCLAHFKKFMAAFFEVPGRWEIYRQAAMQKDYVNTTYEEAERNNFWQQT
jgi:hypothetical protein